MKDLIHALAHDGLVAAAIGSLAHHLGGGRGLIYVKFRLNNSHAIVVLYYYYYYSH